MVHMKRHITVGKYHLLGVIAAVIIISALWCQSFVSLADSTGTITVGSAKIRAEANTNSAAVGSVARGATVTIIDEVQDSSGTLWYQVNVNGNTTGYIRSDLVDKQDDGTSQDAAGDTGVPGASVNPDSVMDAQYAVVSAEAINVRSAPATNESAVDRLTKDTQVIVSGQSNGSDGKVWYYVIFTGTNGAERSGYIRSDLLSLGDMVPVQQEEAPQQVETVPEPETPVNNEYELTYEQIDDGSYAWILYDYTSGTNQADRYLLQQLMEATRVRSENDAADAKALVRQRIAIVALIVLAVLLIVVIVVMALKLRDVYYEDYEDEEEEVAEEVPSQRRRVEEAEETPTRRRTGEEDVSSRRKRRVEEEREEQAGRSSRRNPLRGNREREVEYRDDDAGSAVVKTTQKRKAKNFLMDDDEFEFEFLNMDDKDL